jgi:acetyltransferase-like isoleucine patch superfamily enzyme/acyl carrier protein
VSVVPSDTRSRVLSGRLVRRSLTSPSVLRRCDHVGRNPKLIGTPAVENLGAIAIGDDFQLASEPVPSHLVTGPSGTIDIGHGVAIAHGAAIASHARISIGDGASIGAFALIMDTDFHEVGDRSVAPESKPIVIGARARIGGRVTILRGAVIGAGAIVMSGSVVSGEVPAGARVAGVPARSITSGAGARTDGTIVERVSSVVARTFGLAEPPGESTRPDMIEGWDSLGTLNLLLSLEDEFDVRLEPEHFLSVKRVSDLLVIVEKARPR